MPNLQGTQLTFPPPDGETYMCYRADTGRPVAFSATDPQIQEYWRERTQAESLNPPPPGMVYFVDSRDRLHTLPDHGDGYREIRVNLDSRIIVPAYMTPAPTNGGSRIGPSAFDCPAWCQWRDGCAQCNSSEWRICFGGGCGSADYYRIPPEAWAERRECLCFVPCEACGDSTGPNVLTHTYEDSLICRDCRNRYWSLCDHCNDWYRDAEISGHELGCREDCDDDCCRSYSDDGDDDYNDNGELIHSYSYKPYPQFKGSAPYYLGLECELNTRDNSVGEVARFVAAQVGDTGYLKSDCSINSGFELVTHPMSYEWALANFPWGMFDRLRSDYGMRNTSDCGIHVHVSRTAFDGASHLYRWQKLFYRNEGPIQQLARRTDNSYARFYGRGREWAIHYAVKPDPSDSAYDYRGNPKAWYVKTPEGRKRAEDYGDPNRTERYSAINVENQHTLEVRIFSGSVYQSQVKAALGLVHATVEYTRGLNAHAVMKSAALTFNTFRSWVKDNNVEGKYDSLLSEIERLVG